MEDSKYIIISLGGSLIVPDEIDTQFIQSFSSMIKGFIEKGFKFVFIVGGGKICRKYQDALVQIGNTERKDIDWLGIYVTHLNAQLVRLSMSEFSYENIVTDMGKLPATEKPIIVGAGHEPGASTDLNAVFAAEKVGAKIVINLSNIDYAYNKDPKEFPDAIKIEQSSWVDFRKILPVEWSPGLNAPFDPIAAAKAESLGLEVVIMNGKNLSNIENYLNGEAFVGTVIK
jgi:uridylate kinase